MNDGGDFISKMFKIFYKYKRTRVQQTEIGESVAIQTIQLILDPVLKFYVVTISLIEIEFPV